MCELSFHRENKFVYMLRKISTLYKKTKTENGFAFIICNVDFGKFLLHLQL